MATVEHSNAATRERPLPSSRLPQDWTVRELETHLGVPPERIRLHPPPGMATEQDVLDLEEHRHILCELIDGILVEKSMGWYESTIAQILGGMLQEHLRRHKSGLGLGADAAIKLLDGQVRMPDLCFVSRERVTRADPKRGTLPTLVPNLAIEVLSESNTDHEMQRKLRDYFLAGVECVWLIDRQTRSAKAFSAADRFEVIASDGLLDAGAVLPGFVVSLAELFQLADEQAGLTGSDQG